EPADLYSPIAKFRLDITKIDRPDNSFDVVIANHVFEHVDDDALAMREMFRVLKSGGYGFFSVPINLSREQTYENRAVTTPDERFVHFGGTDHRRYYGRDFKSKLENAGFTVEVYRRPQEDEVKWGLLR
ncbi:class I SAM-dependent methyltransferase, partial [Herbaspirillum sp. HC18]